jgi:hypothetical protein
LICASSKEFKVLDVLAMLPLRMQPLRSGSNIHNETLQLLRCRGWGASAGDWNISRPGFF